MVGAQHGGPIPCHTAEIAPRLVPVAQLIGYGTELGRDRQHRRILLTEARECALKRLLQHAACGGQLAELAVHGGKPAHGLDHVGVIGTEPDGCDVRDGFQQVTRRGQVALSTQPVGVGPDSAQLMWCGHSVMVPAEPVSAPVRRASLWITGYGWPYFIGTVIQEGPATVIGATPEFASR